MALAGTAVAYILLAYEFVLIGRIALSWILVAKADWTPRGPALIASEFVYTVTDPPIKLIRRVVKPVRLGRVALDLSVLVLFIVIAFLMRLNLVVFF
ncbi:MAG: YggT family protein [Propionibacteriaceae bacterium]|jgi:YggT family protein|nr:YggT family protein [Propionibacteriaceae bacterium]